jgi:putative SOS response-associated peptidase YedK
LKSGDLFAMAGIFESDPETGKRRFTILTKSAGIQASALHDRMPAILTQNLEKEWISGGIPDEEFMQKICGAEEPELNIFSISPKINSSFENEATLLQPVSYSVAEQLSLF